MRSPFALRHGFWCLMLFALITFTLQLYSYRQYKSKPHIVFGIITAENKREIRDAQRNTWLSTAMHADIPFKLTYKFVMDLPTKNTTEENNIYNDIVYLNVTHHGRAVKYGEKNYVWIKYIVKNYPDAYLGARLDDDVFLCVPEIFKRLHQIKSSKLYYGWRRGRGNKISRKEIHLDEMFLVFGRELMQRISKRKYCDDRKKCNATTQLVDLDYGGLSFAQWISIYDDIDLQPDNNRMIYYGRRDLENSRKKYADYVNTKFCDNWLLYHKSTPDIMQKLHRYQSG